MDCTLLAAHVQLRILILLGHAHCARGFRPGIARWIEGIARAVVMVRYRSHVVVVVGLVVQRLMSERGRLVHAHRFVRVEISQKVENGCIGNVTNEDK